MNKTYLQYSKSIPTMFIFKNKTRFCKICHGYYCMYKNSGPWDETIQNKNKNK